jgi:hypothetical protein
MTYAIAQVIFGVPLNIDEENDTVLVDALEEFDAQDGFLTYYSGSGDTPAAFGVELDCFDECCYSIDIANIKLEPSDGQRRKFYELWEHLEPEMRAEIKKASGQTVFVPRTFILWSTS